LERKIEGFLTQALCGYKVPEEQVQQVLTSVGGIGIRSQALKVMQLLFQKLSMYFDFSLDDIQAVA
jgi:hypothetical protein